MRGMNFNLCTLRMFEDIFAGRSPDNTSTLSKNSMKFKTQARIIAAVIKPCFQGKK